MCPYRNPFACHAERSEESARGGQRFFAALSMTGERATDFERYVNVYGTSLRPGFSHQKGNCSYALGGLYYVKIGLRRMERNLADASQSDSDSQPIFWKIGATAPGPGAPAGKRH